ncbi:hypothetical protein ACNP8W_003536 [Klebsiella variicola]
MGANGSGSDISLTLSPLCDKEKEQNRVAVTQGKLNAQAAQSDPAARAAARAKLVAGGNVSPSEEQISAQVSRTATADYGRGKSTRRWRRRRAARRVACDGNYLRS